MTALPAATDMIGNDVSNWWCEEIGDKDVTPGPAGEISTRSQTDTPVYTCLLYLHMYMY